MKFPIATTILVLLFSLCVVAQTKVDEYERSDSDSEGGRLDTFLAGITEHPGNKGLVVIYSGEKGISLAAALRDVSGIKRWIAFRSTERHPLNDRIFFRIVEGNRPLFKELWIYPDGMQLINTELPSVSLDNLGGKYLYASVCASCEPAVPELSTDFVNLQQFANLLERYPSRAVLIAITPNSFKGWSRQERRKDALSYGVRYRDALIKEHRIQNKISIKIAKYATTNDAPVLAKFYIVPDKLIR